MDGISVFLNVKSYAYKNLPEFKKNYSVKQHLIDTEKIEKYKDGDYWKNRLSGNLIAITLRRLMEAYWDRDIGYSIIDIGANYGILSIHLAKYIKATGHNNRIYAFDCGNASRLTGFNIKLNQLDDLITFERTAVTNASIPQLVYYDPEHPEDDHIARRSFVSLSSYVVDGISLDDYFARNKVNSMGSLIIKIDTQGVEPLIFEGMKQILEEKTPSIIFEFIPWVCKSIDRDPNLFLRGFPQGYQLYNINEKDSKLEEIVPRDIDNFVNRISAQKPPYTDLLLLHKNSSIDPNRS